tara:strand:- start:281 stop:1933 length:1653 start_codon:yes stop_codon:yes gene_type:complete
MITDMANHVNADNTLPDLMTSTLQNAALMQANTIATLENIIADQKEMIATREERIQLLLRQKYCSRSEKLKLAENGQLNLFDEISAPIPEEPEPETTLVPAHERKKKGGGRRALPDDLMRIRREYILEGAELDCAACGEQMAEIGEETSEQLEIIPAVAYVVEHAVKKYACKHCEECIKQANKPNQPIPKSIAGPGLLSHIIVSKFCDSLPLYRQESILRRSGVDLDRSRLCQWLKHCAKLLSPLVLLLRGKILVYDVSFADETTVQVLKEVGRKAQKQSYMWVFSGGQPEQFSIVYRYYPGRNGVVATDFFEGYEGYLHADGYVGYNPVCSKKTKRIGCWGHTRRYFVDVLKGLSKDRKPGLADEALARIGKLYKIERQAKKEKLPPDKIKALRQKESKPILEDFKLWLEKYKPKTSSKMLIGKAIRYALNHWPSLLLYLEDGRLEIDNNRSERMMKAFAVGRKNWMFYDQVAGAEAGAIYYSLIETCKHHGIDPYLWMRYALKMIPLVTTPEALLPYNCDPNVLKQDLEQDRQNVLSKLYELTTADKE